jgi:transcriptional regulator with XRE-family HTH domain
MIQQPELGKKIADYRKAKGLTQEELVDKCNLSVRTLQRIEAGVVTPRTYTVRLIFEALDITYDNSFDTSFGENKGLILKRLEQFYINFIDLFNLKTNTMKKILILTVMVSSVVLGIFAINGNTVANDKLSAASENQLNHSTSSILDTSMWYSYLHSEESFYDNNDLIARNIKFTSHGVTIASKLIKVNQDTREFITTFASGKLSNEKVEVFISNDIIQEIKYSADMIDESYRKFHLRGNARIDAGEFRFIEANEIIITTD